MCFRFRKHSYVNQVFYKQLQQRDTNINSYFSFQKISQSFIYKTKNLKVGKKKENLGSLLWIHMCLKWLTLSIFSELSFASSLAACHVQWSRKICFTDLEVYACKWVKTGSVVEWLDSKRILISFNTKCQEIIRKILNSWEK